MREKLIIVFMLLLGSLVVAQDGLMPIELWSTMRTQIKAKDSLSSMHPEVMPYSNWTIQRFTQESDSAEFENLPLKRGSKSYLRIFPVLELSGYNQSGSQSKQGLQSMIGGGIGLGINNKFYLQLKGLRGFSSPTSYLKQITDSLGSFPRFGYASNSSWSSEGFAFNQMTFSLAYRPSEYIELFAGRGNHFIGEGYRSLFLSDFSSNYNYVRADVNVWRIKYMILYSQMRGAADYPRQFYPLQTKYSTTHYLSLNITNWWSVGAFESIIWESEDSVINRDIDINYLNPIIFFRPVEYSLGSSDNSLLGFSSTLRPAKGLSLYGQILFDDIVFDAWLAPFRQRFLGDSTTATGWWANKQSYQLGVKYLEPFGWRNASVLAEVNIVRPFTYGHSNRLQSYTNFNLPLAHPLGANFIEWVQITTWQPGRWELGLLSTYSRKGYTNQISYMGEDILISNIDRDDARREYGNFLLQGRRVDVANMRLNVGYTLIQNWNLRAETTIHYRFMRSQGQTANMVFIGLGLKTALWNSYRNL